MKIIFDMRLSTLAIIVGLGMALPQIYGLVKPDEFRMAVRKFPRSLAWGMALMIVGTVWFLYNFSQESISDFETIKKWLFLLFTAVGLGSCLFIHDFLAVRGLAVVLLLLAKWMVDTGRPQLGNAWVLIFQAWAYALVIAGIWLTVAPWRLRDLLDWATANEKRIKIGCAVRLALGLFIAVLGLTKY